MTRAYIRLDPAFDERKYEYPDGAYSALVATLCLAEHQPERGRFRSRDYLSRLLGKRGKWVAYLVEHGDVSDLADGMVYVVGWDEWQEGDWKVAERVRRIRDRRRGNADDNGEGNGRTVTSPPPGNGPPSEPSAGGSGAMSAGADGAAQGEPADPADTYWRLTGRFPSDGALTWIDKLAEQYGPEQVSRVMAGCHIANRDASTLIGRTKDVLRRDARQLDMKEREDEKRRLAEKRAQPRVAEKWREDFARALHDRYGDYGEAA